MAPRNMKLRPQRGSPKSKAPAGNGRARAVNGAYGGSCASNSSTPALPGATEINSFAKKLPKPFATDDPQKDAHLLACWRAGQKVISALMEDWELALTTWNQIELQHEATQENTAGWDPSTVNCGRLPKYFMGQCLVGADTSAIAHKFNQTILDKVDAADAQGIRRIFYMHTMGGVWMHVPRACREDKALTREVFCERIHAVNGIRDWCRKAVDTNTGRIDWLSSGPYKFTWGPDAKATEVQFFLGDKASPSRSPEPLLSMIRGTRGRRR